MNECVNIIDYVGIRDMLLEFYPNGNANTKKVLLRDFISNVVAIIFRMDIAVSISVAQKVPR